jgi:hypothetical protein
VATVAPDAAQVIEAKIAAASAFAARLADKAAQLAEAHGEIAFRARREDPSRWRRAALLWPLFAKER